LCRQNRFHKHPSGKLSLVHCHRTFPGFVERLVMSVRIRKQGSCVFHPNRIGPTPPFHQLSTAPHTRIAVNTGFRTSTEKRCVFGWLVCTCLSDAYPTSSKMTFTQSLPPGPLNLVASGNLKAAHASRLRKIRPPIFDTAP
jgi:hypothetical protein